MTGEHGDFRFSPRANRASEIVWRRWGEEAFAEAQRLERPVLLSLSAVWCHWCHVMDETSYSDPRVIELINRDYVPVRVDNDRNPDVNRRYNMGGWPTTAFLTGTGEVLTGATYLPPDQMVSALERVKAFFDEHRSEFTALAAEPTATDGGVVRDLVSRAAVSDDAAFAGDSTTPGDIVDQIALEVVRAFDPVHGGLGREPKFPQADAFAFLLAYAGRREGSNSPLLAPARLHEVLRVTLTHMAAGDMYDRIGGGFFRYATRRDWSTPHFEKMLEDNARLALLYLEAASGPGDAGSYRGTAEGVLDYLLDTLWQGAPPVFSGSQDADEHYYGLDAHDRARLDVPFIDTTVYVDWNALAAQALLRGACVLARPELAESAVALLDHLWDHARREGAFVHYLSPDGEQGATGALLTDQAAVAAALLDAYETTGRADLLRRAEALADWVGERLGAPDGRLFDRAAEKAAGGLLARPVPALEENALMADVFLRLGAYTGEPGHRERALTLLAAWAPHLEGFGLGAAPCAAAMLRYLERPQHLVIVGALDDETAAALHAAALAVPRALRTVERLDPRTDAERLAARGLPAGASAAAAYVCRGASCLAPARSPQELRERLAGGR